MGDTVYCLLLLGSLSGMHDVFHVSILMKYVGELKQVLEIELLNLTVDLMFKKRPTQILD